MGEGGGVGILPVLILFPKLSNIHPRHLNLKRLKKGALLTSVAIPPREAAVAAFFCRADETTRLTLEQLLVISVCILLLELEWGGGIRRMTVGAWGTTEWGGSLH